MADVEVPDPDDAKEKAGDPFTRRVALFVAVYAVALSVTALGGGNAAKDMMMAQQQAANMWAYYQAKVVRENLYLLEGEKFDLEMELRSGELTDAARVRMEKTRDRYRGRAAEYKAEKEEIRSKAEEFEKDRDRAARRDPYFDFAEVLLQVAIVLASVAMLSGKRWAFYLSLGLAAVGALLGLNGFALIV